MRKLLIIVLLTLSMVACSNQNNYTSEKKNFEDVQRKFPNVFEKLEEETEDFEEIQKEFPNAFEMLTEGENNSSAQLEQKVLEDMKNNPDKVKFAVPIEMEVH